MNSGDSIRKSGGVRPAIRIKIKTSLESYYGNSLNLQTVKKGDVIKFGTYEQDNNLANGKEPIEWQVLDVKNSKVLLLSRYGLDAQPYDTSKELTKWESCTLRNWLNEIFIKEAFTSGAERNAVLATTVTADKNPNYKTDPGKDTEDKIFLLSITEVKNYLSTDSKRACSGTEHCYARGAYKQDENCAWWLRTPGYRPPNAAFIGVDGYIGYIGRYVYDAGIAVRPAMWIDLES